MPREPREACDLTDAEKCAAYLASRQRAPFSNADIWWHYTELDLPAPKHVEWKFCPDRFHDLDTPRHRRRHD